MVCGGRSCRPVSTRRTRRTGTRANVHLRDRGGQCRPPPPPRRVWWPGSGPHGAGRSAPGLGLGPQPRAGGPPGAGTARGRRVGPSPGHVRCRLGSSRCSRGARSSLAVAPSPRAGTPFPDAATVLASSVLARPPGPRSEGPTGFLGLWTRESCGGKRKCTPASWFPPDFCRPRLMRATGLCTSVPGRGTVGPGLATSTCLSTAVPSGTEFRAGLSGQRGPPVPSSPACRWGAWMGPWPQPRPAGPRIPALLAWSQGSLSRGSETPARATGRDGSHLLRPCPACHGLSEPTGRGAGLPSSFGPHASTCPGREARPCWVRTTAPGEGVGLRAPGAGWMR